MNCHGHFIKRVIENHNHDILNDYELDHIFYKTDILVKKTFDDDQLKKISEADVLIIQYIKKDRGMLKHTYIIDNLIKEDAKFLLVPHYTFSGYFYDNNLIDNVIDNSDNIKSSSDIDKLIESNYNFEKDNVIDYLNSELEHIRELDMLGDLNLFDFVKDNYKKYRLFQNRPHPNNLFISEMTNQILLLLGYDRLQGEINNNILVSNHVGIIFDDVREILNLEFDNQILYHNNKISLNEYFKIIFHENLGIVLPDELLKGIDKKFFKKRVFIYQIGYNTLPKILEIIRETS